MPPLSYNSSPPLGVRAAADHEGVVAEDAATHVGHHDDFSLKDLERAESALEGTPRDPGEFWTSVAERHRGWRDGGWLSYSKKVAVPTVYRNKASDQNWSTQRPFSWPKKQKAVDSIGSTVCDFVRPPRQRPSLES